MNTLTETLTSAAVSRNPAWAQLLGLCPLLAVSNSMVNAVGLACASAFVMIGASASISCLRRHIPVYARLPIFVLIIAGFTSTSVMLMQAYAFDLYLAVALFVQIIVTNCMILGRIEAFASHQPPALAIADAFGTAAGFALALIVLGGIRETLGRGTLFADMDRLFGPVASQWQITILPDDYTLLLASLPPGAFIIAGLLLGIGGALTRK